MRREPIDVVISDLYRPGMDGLALCCDVNREQLPTRTILLTSSSSPREFLLGLYAGATHVMAKTCNNESLVARTLQVLQLGLPASQALPASEHSVWDSAVTAGPRLSEAAAAIAADHSISVRRIAYLAAATIEPSLA